EADVAWELRFVTLAERTRRLATVAAWRSTCSKATKNRLFLGSQKRTFNGGDIADTRMAISVMMDKSARSDTP
ncbi:MAG: hypothetical protein KDB22_27770, partial [Planctomycetales bacterium]|nr:hypothetical protein [Planctomycetales bacterium]